jgi:Uma2 family endonuclease
MTQSFAYAGGATLRDRNALTVGQFVAQYGDDRRYELIDGELRDWEPTGPHESVAGTLAGYLFAAILQAKQPWIVPKNCLIQPPAALATVLRPDLLLLDEGELVREPLWSKEPIVCNGSTIKFVAEITSTNWQDDYARTVEEYALLGILEYWIVDFRGLGGTQFIGSPKQPMVTVNQLVEGRYLQRQFGLGETIVSPLFPDLRLMLDDLMPR